MKVFNLMKEQLQIDFDNIKKLQVLQKEILSLNKIP